MLNNAKLYLHVAYNMVGCNYTVYPTKEKLFIADVKLMKVSMSNLRHDV